MRTQALGKQGSCLNLEEGAGSNLMMARLTLFGFCLLLLLSSLNLHGVHKKRLQIHRGKGQ